MASSVRRVLRSPGTTFVQDSGRSRLGKPAAVVFLTGVLYGLATVLDGTEPGPAGVGHGVTIDPSALVAGLGTVLTTVLVWLLFAGAFYAVAACGFEALGDPRDLLATTGWGFLGLLCTAIATLVTKLSVQVLGGGAATAGPATGPVALALTVFALVAFCWTVYAWIQAVRATFALALPRSIVTVTLPLLAAIVLYWVSLFLAAGA